MQLVRFDDVARFAEAVTDFLAAREAENNLFLGLLSTLKVNPYAYGGEYPYMALVKVGDEVCGAALRTPPHHLHVSWMADSGPLEVILPDVQREYGSLPGIFGISPLVRTAAEQWHRLTGQPYNLSTAERSYQLEKVNPVPAVTGEMRQITEADRDLMVDWLVAFAMDAHLERDRARAEKGVAAALEGKIRRLYLWEDNGVPVSLAGCAGETLNGIRVGPVYTPLEYRRKGYATALVAALSQLLLDEGRKYCFLFTDLSNPTSNHIYMEIGYQPVCDMDMYRFGEASG